MAKHVIWWCKPVSIFNTLAGLCLLLTVLMVPVCQAKRVTDIAGHQVTIPDNPSRIIVGESRMLYSILLLQPDNPTAHILAWPQDLQQYDPQTYQLVSHTFPQLTKVIPLTTSGVGGLDPEQVLALKPDLLILPITAQQNQPNTLLNALQSSGIPVIYVDFRVHLLRNTVSSLRLLGEVLNQKTKAEEFIKLYQTHMNVIAQRLAQANLPKPKVLLQLHLGRRHECCVTAVNGSLGELLNFAGGENIAANEVSEVFGKMSEEAVLAAQPDFYFATGMADSQRQQQLQMGPYISVQQTRNSLQLLVSQNPVLKHLAAWKNNKTATIWHNFYLTPWHVAAVEFMAKTLYPSLFPDLTPQQTLQRILTDFCHLPAEGSWLDRPEATSTPNDSNLPQ